MHKLYTNIDQYETTKLFSGETLYSDRTLEGALPRYFFDIKDGQDFPDLQGSEFPDLAAARIEAVRFAAEVLKEMPERFWNCEEWTMNVANSERKPLFTLKFLAETVST